MKNGVQGGKNMAKVAVKFTFPEKLVKEPLIFRMAKEYDLMPNIRRAQVSETAGEVVLEIEGTKNNIEKGLKYISDIGVIVENIPGDIVEG